MEFISLCYHYIQNKESRARFPRIWGNTEEQFQEHVKLLLKNYLPISPKELNALFSNKESGGGKRGVLFTFDDGLSDHYLAARILAKNNVRGIFFIPTCILVDKLPANPQIIHYTLARYGINKLLEEYHNILNELHLDSEESYLLPYIKGEKALETITRIKNNFKYTLPNKEGREVLIKLYRKLLLKDSPNILEEIHLNEQQIRDMIAMGHSIGAHSHTHISIAASSLTANEFKKEIIEPKEYLEKKLEISVDALSYPFGGKEDCLDAQELIEKTSKYKFAFTVEPIINDSQKTHPFEIGRFEPWPKHDAELLQHDLNLMKISL